MILRYRSWAIEFYVFWLIASILAMSLFYSLGLWQLQRYQDKQEWLYTQSEWSIEGFFLPNFTVYLDNKILNGVPGYEVFQAFQLHKKNNKKTSPELVLISRGFVAQPKNNQQHYSRSTLPTIHLPSSEGKQAIILSTKKIGINLRKYPRTYLESDLTRLRATLRMSKLDLPEIEKILKTQFVQLKLPLQTSYYCSLSNTSPYQLSPLPETNTWLKPHKHLGYAAQWFAFCLLTLILFIRFGIRRIKQ